MILWRFWPYSFKYCWIKAFINTFEVFNDGVYLTYVLVCIQFETILTHPLPFAAMASKTMKRKSNSICEETDKRMKHEDAKVSDFLNFRSADSLYVGDLNLVITIPADGPAPT